MRVLQYSSLKNEIDKIFRLDAEHYRKKYQISISKLSNLTTQRLGSLLSIPVCTGHTPSMQNDSFYGGSVKFIKTDNVRENKITDFFTDYLSDKGASELKKSNLISGDVITTITGATYDIVGRTAMGTDELLPANINQNIALIRCNSNKINPYFLNCYLNTYIGRSMLHCHSRQTEQVNLNCREVERVLVPIFNNEFQKIIEELYKKSEKIILDSKIAYQSAQDLLLDYLGLKDFNPPAQKVNIKSFVDSFGTSGRLDAEFYQEKYDVLIQKMKSQEYDELQNLVSIKKSIEPGSSAYDEQGLPFIRVSDYDKFQISSPAKYLSDAYCQEYCETLKNLQPKKGTILFSKDGTVGIAHLLSEDLSGITSGAILHLKVKDKRVLPEYLTLVLNSLAVQWQAERDVGGSIIQHWRIEEIKEVVIPIISMEIQTQIADLIRQSDRLRQESQALLEEAKRKVEQAIEG